MFTRLTFTTTVYTSQQVVGRYIARTSHRDIPCQQFSCYQHHHGVSPLSGILLSCFHTIILFIDSPIVANISLYNDPGSPFPTTLDVHTGNRYVLCSISSFYATIDIASVSNLTANVTILASNKNPPLRPNFIANLRTFSGSLSTNFLHDPNSSATAVKLQVSNDLGPTNVTLDSLFQGVFQVSTKQATVSVTQGTSSVTDPWVPGLPRTMLMEVNSTTRSNGWIGWGDMETSCNAFQQGEVLVDTSLADATLLFLG